MGYDILSDYDVHVRRMCTVPSPFHTHCSYLKITACVPPRVKKKNHGRVRLPYVKPTVLT